MDQFLTTAAYNRRHRHSAFSSKLFGLSQNDRLYAPVAVHQKDVAAADRLQTNLRFVDPDIKVNYHAVPTIAIRAATERYQAVLGTLDIPVGMGRLAHWACDTVELLKVVMSDFFPSNSVATR